MRERICCILGEDERYVLRLADYFNTKKLLPFNVMVFTDMNALVSSGDKYDIKLLIIDGDYELSDEIDCEAVVRLSENEEIGEVNRYQPAYRLAKAIISCIPEYSGRNGNTEKAVSINCIYSPATKCFKTTLALGLGLWAAKKERSLYINLEEFAGLDEGVFKNTGGLSQALYHFKSFGERGIGKIVSCTDQIYGMDYFYPVTCPEDISELSESEMVRFINVLADSGMYKSIWIDLGNTYDMPWNVMDISDRVIVPAPLDYVGRKKVSQMENYLIASGRTELVSRMEKVEIPYDSTVAGYEINPEWILKTESRGFFTKLLEDA